VRQNRRRRNVQVQQEEVQLQGQLRHVQEQLPFVHAAGIPQQREVCIAAADGPSGHSLEKTGREVTRTKNS